MEDVDRAAVNAGNCDGIILRRIISCQLTRAAYLQCYTCVRVTVNFPLQLYCCYFSNEVFKLVQLWPKIPETRTNYNSILDFLPAIVYYS